MVGYTGAPVHPELLRGAALLFTSIFTWLMVFGLMGLFLRLFRRERPAIRYVSDSAYWLYLAHVPLLFPIQAMLLSLDISAFIKMPLVCLLTAGLLLLSYRFMVRYTWLGRMLNGKRE